VGTITDFDGNYSLEVPSGKHILVISYIGYKTQDITVGKSNQLNIKMEADTQALDEVVVVGYGVMKKRDLTGSIASVKAADIVKSPASNAMEALQGQVPGLDIVRNSGKATSGVTINIRGQRSLSDVKDEFGNNVANAPLFIIDGMQGGDFSDIAPADIESIEVLKDASSTAIYGSQGANGVIIITTKKGERVRVIDGRFKGLEGEIKRINGDHRLIVTIEGICAVATTYIPRCFLEKI
jgi:TonB-dependent SusC/RagA subfamily outer membrane receptor